MSNVLAVLFLSLNAAWGGDIQLVVEEGDYKKAITLEKKDVADASAAEKSQKLRDLSLLYLKDQNQEAAFATFIESLETSHPTPITETQEAQSLYKEALDVYLDGNCENPKANAQKIIERYAQKLKDEKTPSPLGYLLASAYANLGKYEEFMAFFYDSYQAFPEHFLAYKTKAILHIKLLERRRSDAERKTQREAVLANLDKALSLQPQDISLYRMLITFSFPEKRQQQIPLYLNKILDGNIIIPRTELQFYIQEATDIKDFTLAQKFIDRAKQWYPNSRILNTAQNYLNAKKEEVKNPAKQE